MRSGGYCELQKQLSRAAHEQHLQQITHKDDNLVQEETDKRAIARWTEGPTKYI